MVNHPPHYKHGDGGPECIDWIEMCLTKEEFRGYLAGNALKYIWRYKMKGHPKQDLKKAQWYLDKLGSLWEFGGTIDASKITASSISHDFIDKLISGKEPTESGLDEYDIYIDREDYMGRKALHSPLGPNRKEEA